MCVFVCLYTYILRTYMYYHVHVFAKKLYIFRYMQSVREIISIYGTECLALKDVGSDDDDKGNGLVWL